MSYAVKEIFYTLQGEGANSGRAAAFIRFTGCNLWSGREKDRPEAVCKFCDTDFIGGRRYAASDLVNTVVSLWPAHQTDNRFVVLTGGEPALQIDRPLVHALKHEGFQVAVETNGTIHIPSMGIDWVCVSPKAGTELRVTTAEEIKLVFPQIGLMPHDLRPLHAFHRWISPMDGPNLRKNTLEAINFCKANPEWKLTMQSHKIWNIR